jgi:hypothetical protein
MKKILLYTLTTIAIGLFSGCDKYLETESKSSNSVDATFASVTDANNALMGAYAQFCEDAMYSSRMSLFWMTNTDIEITSMGDNDYRNTDRRGLSNYGSRPSVDIPDVTNPWNSIYRAIERLNLCIENIPISPATKGEHEKQMMAYYAEALTLRALLYTELVRQWGDVPFRTKPATPATFYVPRTDRDVIYEHLLSDLAEAIDYLPWVNESGSQGVERASKGFALGLTARIAMYRAGYSLRTDGETRQGSNPEVYYQIAKEACQKLILEGPHKLTPNFHDYFIAQCRNETDHTYMESLFEIGFGIGKSGEVGYSNGTRFEAACKYTGVASQGYVNTTPIFLYSFDPEDTRRDVTVNFFTYKNATVADAAAGPVGFRQVILSNPNGFRIGKWSLKYLTGAALSGSAAASAKYQNGINWPIMRMADVYLLLAEAEYRLNGVTSVAQEALKVVRRRAFPVARHVEKVDQYVAGLSGAAFFDAIVNERAWELAGEAVRKYDLVRWNLLAIKLEEFKTENLAFIGDGYLPAKYPNSRYNPIPSTLYYKFDTSSDYPEIDMSTVNLYQALPAAPDADYYVFENWIKLKDGSSTKESYETWITSRVNYGYDPAVNNHLFAYPSSVISTAGGLFDNDAYWSTISRN